VAELIAKEIINPFRQEIKSSKVELELYSKLLSQKKNLNEDNTEFFKDLYSQLLDNNDNIISVK
jgi:hypothetical protein